MHKCKCKCIGYEGLLRNSFCRLYHYSSRWRQVTVFMNQLVESLTQSIHSNTMNHSRMNGSMNESLNQLRNRFVHNTDSIISVRAVLNVIFSTAKLPDPSNYTSNLIQCSLKGLAHRMRRAAPRRVAPCLSNSNTLFSICVRTPAAPFGVCPQRIATTV